MNIIASYDSSITSLNSTLQGEIEGAIQAAVTYYDSMIATNQTVRISFGYGEVNGSPVGAVGQSSYLYFNYTYSQVRAAALAADVTSPIQTAAAALLGSVDPTSGASFDINLAEAKALGLSVPSNYANVTDGYVGISSTDSFSWSQSNIAAGTFDAVATFEHEISEVLGRTDEADAYGGYTLLDMYRYTAADGLATDKIGAAAGARDEPFVSGYNSSAQSYFSFDGKTVTLPYGSPSEVASGWDVADWSSTVIGDSYGAVSPGTVGAISTTDLETMNVLGYTIADTITQTIPASLNGVAGVSVSLSGLSVAETSSIGGNILTTTLSAASGVFNLGSSASLTVAGAGTGTLTLTGLVGAINAALAGATYLLSGAYNGVNAFTISMTTTGGGTNTSGTKTTSVNVQPRVSVSQFGTYRASLDTAATGFQIVDTAAHVTAALATLATDTHIASISFTDAGTPVVALTASQALNSLSTIQKISGARTLQVVDLAANLVALTAAQILSLSNAGFVALIASDANAVFTSAASDEIRALGLTLGAPSGDATKENFSDGSSITEIFGANQTVAQKVARNADGSFIRYVYTPGSYAGASYSYYQAVWTTSTTLTRYDYATANGAVVASTYFSANGGYTIVVGGVAVKQLTVNADGSSDVLSYNVPGVVDGISYVNVDVAYNTANVKYLKTFLDATNHAVAVQYLASNGGFSLYSGSTLLQSKVVNADGTNENSYFQITGQSYSSVQTDLTGAGATLAQTFDNTDGSGSINLVGSNLSADANTHQISLAGVADFTFNAHSPEIYAFATGAANDVIHFHSGFGAAQVTSFLLSASTDILDLSSLFGSFASAKGAMTTVNGNTVITDGANDTLTLLGVSQGSLTSGARFNLT